MIHFIELLGYNCMCFINQVRIHNHQIYQKAVKKEQGTQTTCRLSLYYTKGEAYNIQGGY